MPESILWGADHPFLSIRQRENYSYLHMNRTNGLLVGLLPFRKTDSGYEYLERIEICPAHSMDYEPCAITGGVLPDRTPIQMAIQELKEESGYSGQKEEFIELGTVRPSKQSDTLTYLYAIDVTDKKQGSIDGDGSHYETGAGVRWSDYATILDNKDPLLLVMISRLHAKRG